MSQSSSSSFATLDRDVCSLLVDMRSDKVTVRHKAVCNLMMIVNGRTEQFISYIDLEKFETGWSDIFDATYHSMLKQAHSTSATAKGKNDDYVMLIHKISECAMLRDSPRLTYQQLINYALQGLEDDAIRTHFGLCLVQLIQKFVLGVKWDLTTISYELWRSLIDKCFVLLDDVQLGKQVLHCLSLAIRKFLENCSKTTLLADYFPRLMEQIRLTENNKSMHELIVIGLHVVQAVAVDARVKVKTFLTSLIPYVVKAYDPKMTEEQKSVLFRVMHLGLVMDSPGGKLESGRDDRLTDELPPVTIIPQERNKQLRQLFYIVSAELKEQLSRSYVSKLAATEREVKFVDGFFDFAARLCYTIYWDENGCAVNEESGESSSKKMKKNKQLQSLIDFTSTTSDQNNMCWLIILSLVLERHCAALLLEDYQPLLQQLSELQHAVQSAEQHRAFYRCCEVLLQYEDTQMFRSSIGSMIDAQFCADLWSKILNAACRSSSSTARSIAADSCRLMQLLIRYRKYSGIDFLNGTILEAIYSNAIKKTDASASCLESILETLPSIDCLTGGKDEVLTKMFDYLYLGPGVERTIIQGKIRLKTKLLAQISVLAVVTKHVDSESQIGDHLPTTGLLTELYVEDDRRLRQLERRILFQNVDELIMSEEDESRMDDTEAPQQVTYNVNEVLFDRLCIYLNFDKNILPDEGKKLNAPILEDICYELELYLQILDILMHHQAHTNEQFKRNILTKKAMFKLQLLNMGCQRLLQHDPSFSTNDVASIGERLLAIFRGPYHPAVARVLQAADISSILKWCRNHIDPKQHKDSEHVERLTLDQLPPGEHTHRCYLHTMIHYLQYEGAVLATDVHDMLEDLELNVYSSLDVFYIFDLCRILLRHPSSEIVAQWVLTHVINVCKAHHTNAGITEEIIDLYADLVKFVSPYESMTRNVTVVLNSFLKKCKNTYVYSAELQARVIAQIKHLLRAFPQEFEEPMHKQLYVGLVPLLNSTSYCIKIEVVRNFLHIFHSAWVYGKDAQVSGIYYHFQTMLYEMVDFDVVSTIDDLDERTNAVSGLLQFLLGTFRVCFELRRRSLQDFILLLSHGKLRDAKVATLLRLVSVVSGIEIVKVAQTNLDGLLDVWLSKDYKLEDFPCRLTGASGSIENFVQMHRKAIAFGMLCMHPDRFQSFCQSIGIEYEAMTKLILPRSLAFLLPLLAKCDGLTSKYTTIASQVQKVLTPFLRRIDLKSQIFDILKHLTYRMKDANELEKLLEHDIARNKDDYLSVSCIHYSQSMDYLRHRVLKADGSTVPLLSYLCQENRQSLVEKLLSDVKRWLWGSEEKQQKVVHLFQYVAVVEQLREYIDQQSHGSFAKYLVREVIYFLGNLMSTVPKLRLAIVNCLERVLKLFSSKAYAILSKHLNFIASSLLEVEVLDCTSKLSGKCLALLCFLIIDQSQLYPEAIAKLNYFPADDRFAELRTVIADHKARVSGTAVCSLREEIVGLLALPYLRYEDVAALRLVIASKRNELNVLCKEIGLVDDESVLHPLVFTLLDVVRSSCFDKKSIEAMRCLGELGPLDLKSMELKSDVETIAYETIDTFENAVKRCAEVILTELDVMLTSKNVTVGRSASLAAYEMLQGRTFHSAVAKLPTMSLFLGQSTAEVALFSFSEGSVPQLVSTLDPAYNNYRSFVVQVCTVLLKFLRNKILKELVAHDQGFAEKLVPLLIQASLKLLQDPVNKEIGLFINHFFALFIVCDQDSYDLCNDPKAIQLMLTVVECVRINNEIFPQFSIELDYLKIANAARYCQAHFKSIIYCELWYQDQLERGKTGAKRDRHLMEIMRSSYIAIGVNDAVKEFLNPRTERAEYYQLEQKYNRALVFRDASSSLINPGDIGIDRAERAMTLQLLKDSSLYGLARYFNENDKEIDYECAWRLADWSVAIDISDTAASTSDQCGPAVSAKLFERSHYKALKSLTIKDELAVESAVSEARRAIAELLKHTSTESTKHIYHTLCRLRKLEQIEDFSEILFQKQIDCEQDLIEKWNQQDSLPYSEFDLHELILSQRWSILQTTVGRTKQKWVPGAMYNTLLLLIHEARSRGLHDCALRNLALIETFDLPANAQAIVLLEDAQLNWGMGNPKLACDRAMEVLENKQYSDMMVNTVALRLYGQFQAESDSKELVTLHKDFFDKSLQFVQKLEAKGNWSEQMVAHSMVAYSHRCFESDRHFTVVHTVAKYADREFVRLSKYCQSQEWRMRRENISKMEKELEQLKTEATKASDTRQRDLRRLAALMQKNMQRDKKEVERVEQDRRNYLVMALQYYIDYSRQSTVESDLVVFRIIALWLNNLQETSVQQLMNDRIQDIPSYKFVPVLPQLAPRLSTKSPVGAVVHRTLLRCTLAHPHHTLPYVFAQLHAFKDQSGIDVSNDDRLLGARKLYGDLLKLSEVRTIIEQMDCMNLALIELANKNVSGTASFQQYKMTSHDKLRSLKNLESIHCPTVELRVNESGDYKNAIIGIVKWEPTIIGVGGINAPKKLMCLCTDGKVRTQLLKGKDDMRQDAVMQQVFGIINVLLRHDKETAKRQLSIRTYKVVPLSRQSGILEWCENTIPIGAWMVKGHTKYRPEDYDPSRARKLFQENAQPGKTFDDKLENYRGICRRLQPVFRYYFLEHYLKPGDWFARRQKYVKSVATSSMIGYILGIGDRHVHNILIDKRTAEVIHIDFGIAFELGKNLPTPETIPFRLTRDLVDGMGMTGVEGVFKKSCEKTMEVLRNNQAPIITILEVLLHDPLYSWNVLSNKKANQLQLQDSQQDTTDCSKMHHVQHTSDVNVTAERALMLVTKKLEGMEDDKYISIEGQVQKLIFAATNERNLCQLFHGFQPYL